MTHFSVAYHQLLFFSLFYYSYSQIASIPVGYNNPTLLACARSEAMASAMVNRPALGNFPPHDWGETLRTSLLRRAPPGMDKVFTAMSGSDANENAYKAAFIWRRQRDRGGPNVAFTAVEQSSSMDNHAPGSPALSILSFRHAFHGRLFASLSTTHSKPIHKLDIPAFDWPQATFPQLRYPLDQWATHNREAERESLREVEALIRNYHIPPAAVMIEPIQSEGGDNHASAEFFIELRRLTRRLGVLLIMDEVQTGVGATGRFWAHEHFNLPEPPDIVTFSKKAQAGGFYYADPALRPNLPFRIFNTWMGDPPRTLLFRAIIDEIDRLDLLANTAAVGDYLYDRLEHLAAARSDKILNLRGRDRGTFIAFDTPQRDQVLSRAKLAGINIGGCGTDAVRLRPMLIFQKHHADALIDRLDLVLSGKDLGGGKA